MINKKLLLGSLFLMLLASDAQAISVNYPSKKMLNRADHITSLITTALFIGYLKAPKESRAEGQCCMGFISSASMNALVNFMALKYDKKRETLLKLLLSLTIPIVLIIDRIPCEAAKDAAEKIFFFSIIGNCVKNIWDIYSLTGDMYSSIQDMRPNAHEEA